MYSKAVLRVAAEEVANADDRIVYFPSYEIITGNHTRGKYFSEDLRSVTEEGVRRVMGLFMQHYTDSTVPAKPRVDGGCPSQQRRSQMIADAMAVICDEEALDR